MEFYLAFMSDYQTDLWAAQSPDVRERFYYDCRLNKSLHPIDAIARAFEYLEEAAAYDK
jgi:hypothetical protein